MDEKTKEKPIQRRRSPRRPFSKSIGVMYKGHFVIEKSLEVGELGLLIQSNRNYKVDDRIVVTFFLPEQGSCVFRGIIRYVRGEEENLFGVEFEKVDFHIRRKLRKFVAEKIQRDEIEARRYMG